MRTSRAWCVEMQRTVSIAEVQAAYFEQPEPRRRFTFQCADPACRARAGARMTAVHDDRLFFDDAYPVSAHFASVPQSPHDPMCEDVLREQASALIRNDPRPPGDWNASRRFSTKQAFEVFDVYHPAVGGVLPLSALLPDDRRIDPADRARQAMPARLLTPGADPVPAANAGTPPAALGPFKDDDEAIRALEQAIEAMSARQAGQRDGGAATADAGGNAAGNATADAGTTAGTNSGADATADTSARSDPRESDGERVARVAAMVDQMLTRSLPTRRLADIVACYSELGAVDRQKALIRLPGGRAMSYAAFIQPLARYQDSDEPLVRVGGARVMREERGYVLRFFDRIVLDGERYEVVMRISDARIAASPLSGLLRAQLLGSLGDGHHVRVFFFGGIAPDSRQHNLTQIRLSDLENVVLQPMRVAGAGAGASAFGRNAWPGLGTSRA
ncbi:MAG: hypothetical protein QM766_04545 [Burkholderiaceae bacterium]